MFSIFKIFKKKKVIPHIRLSGVIGSVGKFKQGLNFDSQQAIIEKAFSTKKALAIAISINSPGGSPVQSHLIYSYIRKMAKKTEFRIHLESLVEGRHLKNHPMYLEWANGTLSKHCMAGCMAESYHYVSNIVHAFFMIASRAPTDVVEMELENFSDEMNPANPHPALFLRFIDACGGDSEVVKNGRGLPSTELWTEWLWSLAKDKPWQAAVAAIHVGSEFQSPGTFNAILPALRHKYKFTNNLQII